MVKHSKCMSKLADYQEAERKSRDLSRESIRFLTEEGGQWEERAIKFFKDRPRYQIDHTYPIYSSIANDLLEMSFAAHTVEAGNGARSDIAATYDGMLRSIQSMSSMDLIMAATVQNLVAGGFDAWLVRNDWADVDAFEQDLTVEHIEDAINRVWIGPATKVDFSDVEDAFVITKMSKEEYDKEYPKGSGQGIDSHATNDDWIDEDRPDEKDIGVADYYYIKRKKVTLHLLTDGRVVKDEQYQQFAAELQQQGVTIQRTRTREIPTCYVRRMDGKDWLTDEQETPFGYIPIICPMANYRVVNGKRIYFGVVEKLKDPQRIYNYAASREVSDGALAPVEKIAMTTAQAAGHEEQNSQLNNANDPVFLYNPDQENPALMPFKLPGAQPNMGLQQTRMNTANDMVTITNSYSPSRGEGLSDHSGKAYQILQSKSNLSAQPYVLAIRRAIRQLGKILVDAIPKVYDSRDRQVRLMNEDGTSKYESINQEIYLPGGQRQIMRDLSQGHYDVVVEVGKHFASRKTEGVEAMIAMAQVYPDILIEGADVFTKALDAPFVNQVSERIRERMIREGRIPEKQLTDEERQKIQQEMESAANQPPDPMQEAMLQSLMAEVQKAQAQAAQVQQDMQVQMMEQARKSEESQAKILEMYSKIIENLTVKADETNLAGESANVAATRIVRSTE